MLSQRSARLFSQKAAQRFFHVSSEVKTIPGNDISSNLYRGSTDPLSMQTVIFGLGSRIGTGLVNKKLLETHVYSSTQFIALTENENIARGYSLTGVYSGEETHKLNIENPNDREAFFQCLDKLGMSYGRSDDQKKEGVIYIIDPILLPSLIDVHGTLPSERTKLERELCAWAIPTFAIKSFQFANGTLLDNPLYLKVDAKDVEKRKHAEKFMQRWHELLRLASSNNLLGKEKEIVVYLEELMKFYGNPNLLEKRLPKALIDYYNITGAQTALEWAQQGLKEISEKFTLKK